MRSQGVSDIGGCREGGERAAGDVSFASAVEATQRDRAVVVAVVGAEGDDAPLWWRVRDVSSFQRRGTLTRALTNPGERVSPMSDPAARCRPRRSARRRPISCVSRPDPKDPARAQ